MDPKSLTPETLKNQYLQYVNAHIETNKLYEHSSGQLRLATFNIHYFTDLYEKTNTYAQIIKDIQSINADVIVLQEVLIGGKNTKINENVTIDLDHLFEDLSAIGYSKKIMCNSVPSWYDGIYGNMMLLHNRICTPDRSNNFCEMLDETIYTFPKNEKTVMVSGEHEGTRETRCYIKCKLAFGQYTFYIYGTHLDVSDEQERLEQIKVIMKDAKKHARSPRNIVFIMGDLNTFIPTDIEPSHNARISKYTRKNGKVAMELKREKWVDCHSSDSFGKMTTWNGTRVDFIYCNKPLNGIIPEYYYTLSSDHIPVILTLTPDTKIKRHNNTNAKSLHSMKSKTKTKSKTKRTIDV